MNARTILFTSKHVSWSDSSAQSHLPATPCEPPPSTSPISNHPRWWELHAPSQSFFFFLLLRFGEGMDVVVRGCVHLRHRVKLQRPPRSWTVGKTEGSCDPHGPRLQMIWKEACRKEKDPNEGLDEAKWMDVGRGGPHQWTIHTAIIERMGPAAYQPS